MQRNGHQMTDKPSQDKVVMIGPENDNSFWGLEEAIAHFAPITLRISAKADIPTLVASVCDSPLAVVISQNTPCADLVEAAQNLRTFYKCEVVVVASSHQPGAESRLREAGIFCYLTLPEEEALLPVVLSSALREAKHSTRLRRPFRPTSLQNPNWR
ncbi:MAG: hypothetical protein N3A66_02790 [Planctomycetota bacterium]|nr:hypothetical protein [Planctomycetota bacterium]